MKKDRELIPKSHIAVIGVVSGILLGVFPMPFIILYMVCNNKYVKEEDIEKAKKIDRCMKILIALIILCLVIEASVLTYSFVHIYSELEAYVERLIGVGCPTCPD